MTAHDPEYERSADVTAGRIREIVPENLGEQFRDSYGISSRDFRTCKTASCGEICAVDGSNTFLLESGSLAIMLFRAAQSTFQNLERARRSLTPLQFAIIGHGPENEDFPLIYEECFGLAPGTPLANEDRARAAGILRDTLEYWVMEQMAGCLGPGALLLRDGPLRVSHASHDTVLTGIEKICKIRGIDLAGISKQTSATWGGGHPLLPSIDALAETLGIQAPWWIRIDPTFLDHTQFRQWQHGQAFVARLHSRARSPLKIELMHDVQEPKVGTIMNRLASISRDGRIPGYPYPLFDAHRIVVIGQDIVEKARSDLMHRIAASGISRQTYEILFGDYHEEFARY